MPKPAYRMKIHPRSKRPFMSRVVRNGPIQKWFAENIGKAAGACVSAATKGKHGHSAAVQYAIAKKCAPGKGTIHVPGALRKPAQALNPATAPA